MISVIVPIYNVEKYLRKCIDSILSQSYRDLEVVLVDDGSTDSCPKIIDEYAAVDKRVKAIHKPNEGLVSARQAGLMESTGDYVIYVDGDDWIVESCAEKLFNVVSKHNVDLVCCSAILHFKNKILEKKSSFKSGLYKKKELISDIFPSLIQNSKADCFSSNAWGKLFNRKILLPHQMFVNPEIVMGEDIAFTKPYIASISSMYIINDCLYCYNCMNSESITHSKKSLSWEGPIMIASILKERIDSSDYDFTPQINRYLVHSLFNVAVSRFNSGKPYNDVVSEIQMHTSKPKIRHAIKKASFSYWKGILAKYSLLYNLCFVMYFYWKKKSKN